MNEITKTLKEHYQDCFQAHGATSKGVDWGKQSDVTLRHSLMLNLILNDYRRNDREKPTLLDVGCGFGGFWEFIAGKDIKISYTGLDVAENMIDYAKQNFADANFYNGDIFEYPFHNKFDYVICNGILTQKLETSILKMDKYAKQLIRRMFDLCNKGIAFNIMSTKVNFMVNNLYYHNPVELIGYCFSEFSNKIRLEHSYPLYEYTLYLYKEED